jgi:hypothetical protein
MPLITIDRMFRYAPNFLIDLCGNSLDPGKPIKQIPGLPLKNKEAYRKTREKK